MVALYLVGSNPISGEVSKFREIYQKLSKLSKKHSEMQRKCQIIETQSGGWEGNFFFASLKEPGANDIRLLSRQLDLHAAPASCLYLKHKVLYLKLIYWSLNCIGINTENE